MPLRLVGEDADKDAPTTRVLEVDGAEQCFEFEGITQRPVPSLLRGFSAPVKLEVALSDDELAFLMAHDSDSFNRWEAAQLYSLRVLHKLIEDERAGRTMELPRPFVDAFAMTLGNTALDKALVAEALTLPSETYIAETVDVIDVLAIHRARQFARRSLARRCAMRCLTPIMPIVARAGMCLRRMPWVRAACATFVWPISPRWTRRG